MAQICDQVYNPRTDEYEEYCWDDGTTDTSASDADTAAGLNADTGQLDFSKMYDWNENTDGSKQKVNADGSVDYQDPDGSTYTVKNGIYTTQSEGKTWNFDSKQNGFVDDKGNLIKDAPSNLFSKMLNAVKANPLAALGTAYGALKSFGGKDGGGYNVPIPKLEAVQQQIDYNDPNRRPGSSGRQYFTDTRFVKEGDAASIAGAQAAADAQAKGILAAYKPTAAPAVNPYAGKMKREFNPPAAVETKPEDEKIGLFNSPVVQQNPTLMAMQNKTGMADGGIAMAKGRYLRGGTDGMADKISTSIDGDQPAALSHGEFVIPADVVSHLGNGNSDAGAEKLYQMMDRIRQARTGTKQQGKKINPDKFMPGGLAASKYARGGKVMGFIEGGGVPLDTSKTSTLSPWAGDYVTNMLGKTQALANAPMQTYKGPLTAGASDLQQQGFAGISETAMAGYQPGKFTNQFTAPEAYQAQTTDFLGNSNAAMPTAYAVQKPMGMPTDPGAAYRSTGMPMEDPAPLGSSLSLAGAEEMPTFDHHRFDGMPQQGGVPQQAQTGIAGLQTPQPSQPVGSIAQQYMNPYLQAALNPQLEEARRQSQITQQQNAAKMTGAGAFGGSRQALLDAETQRSLGANLANITGTGYNTAYDKAMQQFNADQARKMAESQFGATQGMTAAQTVAQYGEAAQKANEASRQYSADYGLKSLSDLMRAGETQRAIESEGITADKRQFDEQQARPYSNLEFQRKMLEGLPIGASTTSVNQDAMSKMASDVSGLASLYDKLSKLIPGT